MPKSVRTFEYNIGDRVWYTKNNKKHDCWISQKKDGLIFLKPCFRVFSNSTHYIRHCFRHNLIPFKGNQFRIGDVLEYEHDCIHKVVVIAIDTFITVQVIDTRINFKIHRDSTRLRKKYVIMPDYEPLVPVHSVQNDPYLYAHVFHGDIHGTTVDYDPDSNLYLFKYLFNAYYMWKWVASSELQLISTNPMYNTQDIRIGQLDVSFKSSYPFPQKIINRGDSDLILREMYHCMPDNTIFTSILCLFFSQTYKENIGFLSCCNYDTSKINNIIAQLEKVSTTSKNAKRYLNNLNTENLLKHVPYFYPKLVEYKNDTYTYDIYVSSMLLNNGIRRCHSFHLMKINPIIRHFNPQIINRYTNIRKFNVLENMKKTENHLYPYQENVVNKMLSMEDNKISNIFNFEIWSKQYNYFSGFVPNPRYTASGGIVALDVGLGKTICVIELYKRSPSKTLIVVPLTLIDQWKNEIKRFLPDTNVSEYYGKKKVIGDEITLTTYGTLRCMVSVKIQFDRVVFDEAHTIKSVYSSTAGSCQNIIAPKRWCLTATPFKKKYESILPLLYILLIKPFSFHSELFINYLVHSQVFSHVMNKLFIVLKKEELGSNNPIKSKITEHNQIIEMSSSHSKLYGYLKNKIKDTLQKLMEDKASLRNYNKILKFFNMLKMMSVHPSCVDIIHLSDLCCPDNIQQKTIQGFQGSSSADSEYKKNVCKTMNNITNESCCICFDVYNRPTITKCMHTFCYSCINESLKHKKKCPQCRATISQNDLTELVEKVDMDEKDGMYYITDVFKNRRELPKDIYDLYNSDVESNKLNYVQKLIDESNESFVIFSQFNSTLQFLNTNLKNVQVGMINGKKSRKQRSKTIADFQNKNIRIFLLSTKTSAVGLTLTESFNMVFMEPIIDKEIKDQAIGRLHRIGQEHNIKIYTMISKNTIEMVEDNESNTKKSKINFMIENMIC